MTKLTTAKSQAKCTTSQPQDKNCLHCGKVFTPKRSTGKYCLDACKVAYNRENMPSGKTTDCIGYLNEPCPDSKQTSSKQHRCVECKKTHNRFHRYPNSTIGGQVIGTIKRAGTLETFQNVQAIKDFEFLCKTRSRVNTIKDGVANREYSICHKMPLNHPLYAGYTSAANLFLGSTSLNQEAGQEYGEYDQDESLYIKRVNLKDKYLVDGLNQSQIMDLLYKRFGSLFLNHIVEANHPTRSKKGGGLPEGLEVSGDLVGNVLGASIFTHFGDDSVSAMKLYYNAYVESLYYDADGQTRHLSEPWEIVQEYLQTNDAFACKYLRWDYEPISAGAFEMCWVDGVLI